MSILVFVYVNVLPPTHNSTQPFQPTSPILFSSAVQRVIRVWRVTYLRTTLLATFLGGLAQFAISSLTILLRVFVYLRLNVVSGKFCLRIRPFPPVGVEDLL